MKIRFAHIVDQAFVKVNTCYCIYIFHTWRQSVFISILIQKRCFRAYAPSEYSDRPTHSRRLIRIVTGRILASQECKVFARLRRSRWLSAQADLRLLWAHTPKGNFPSLRLICFGSNVFEMIVVLTHLFRVDSSTVTRGQVHFLYKGYLVSFYLLSCLVEISERNANSVDPGQTPRSAASDLGLYCCQCLFYGTLGLIGLKSVVIVS